MKETEEIVNLINAQEVVVPAGALTVQLARLGEVGQAMCKLDLADKTPTSDQLKDWIIEITDVVGWGISCLPPKASKWIEGAVKDKLNGKS